VLALTLSLGLSCAAAQVLSSAFGQPRLYPLGAEADSVAIGDLNGDGRSDIVVGTGYGGAGTNGQSIYVFLQDAAGGLANPVQYPALADVNSVVVGNFGGDSKLDIAAGTPASGVRVFLQGPAGAFGTFTDYTSTKGRWICAGDFNHDGRADLAGIDWSSSIVDLLLQRPEGTLNVGGPLPATYNGWNDLETADVNNDGLTDIIVLSGQGGGPHLSVLLQTAGGFAAAAPYNFSGTAIGVGDFTGDGRVDVALAQGGNRPSSKLAILPQLPDGTLGAGPVLDSYDIPEAVAGADIDMDGRVDILVLHGGWRRLGVYFQTAPGTFGTEMLFEIPYVSHYETHALAVGDINGDGMPDVAIAEHIDGLVILTNRLSPPFHLTDLRMASGTARFLLHGSSGNTCVVESSPDLMAWAAVVTNTIPSSGSIWVEDPNSTGQPRRFYRASGQARGGAGSNDQFSDRISIPSSGGTVAGSSVGATKELGEPDHAGDAGGKSLWWTWTAPASGVIAIYTDGSSFDTTLAVYQGADLASLVLTAADDDGGAGSQSRVMFIATAGVTYQIAVDGFGGDSGNVTLTVKPGAPNDAFADRWQLIGSSDVVLGANIGATHETGEPQHWPGGDGRTSIWWTWRAPKSGVATLSTQGSNFDTLLAAYTGSQVSGLTLVANNDDADFDFTSEIQFFATAGAVYQIAADGFSGASGGVILTLTQP